MTAENIRNFVIIAHIDHGKSTLADRLLEITGTIDKRRMREQYLDQLELERERGITIKMAPVRMLYKHPTQISADQKADKRGLLYEDLTYKIRGALFSVYNKLGPSYKESVYSKALEEEFKKSGLSYEKEKTLNVLYEGKKVGVYRPDFVVEEKVVLELKAQPFIGKLETKQTWYYLKGSQYRLALLVNFGSQELQIERIVYDIIRDDQRLDPRESAKVEEYILNLIDTPGHSDFSYEVSRALAAVEGAILLVDATQGIQAQTLANFKAAKKAGLAILGAVNKIDLFKTRTDTDSALTYAETELEKRIYELSLLIGCGPEEIYKVSGKTGEGVEELLATVIRKIPSPKVIIPNSQFLIPNSSRALIFDSFYDDHKGVVASIRVFDGEITSSDELYLVATKTRTKIKELGYFTPEMKAAKKLIAGEIGYAATGIKDPAQVKIGETLLTRNYADETRTNAEKNQRQSAWSPRESASVALPGYQEPKPVVFVSFYPENPDDYELLKKSLQKLRLNDAAIVIEPDQNEVLGRGFKVGFLGRLHFEIASERLKREFGVKTITTFPSVAYRVKTKSGWQTIVKPEDLPLEYEEIWEPMVALEILMPVTYLSNLFSLQTRFRMRDVVTENLQSGVRIKAKMSLAELVSDFDDQLKSATAGYASFSYEHTDYEQAEIVKVDILITGKIIPGLSRFLPKSTYEREARQMLARLKELLPREQFAQALQAVALGRVIAREDIPALRKDVTGYLYGGDRTRKMKLWQKQKRGKRRLEERIQTSQRVSISPEIFKELLKK